MATTCDCQVYNFIGPMKCFYVNMKDVSIDMVFKPEDRSYDLNWLSICVTYTLVNVIWSMIICRPI